MTQKPENLLSEYGQVLSGHTALLAYQMSHFCVQADPVALLSMEIKTDAGTMNIESACRPTLLDKYTYGFMPYDDKNMPAIVKAILADHPEFKVGYMMCKEDKAYPVSKELEQDPTYMKVVSARVPDVDSDRRKVALDGIKALYNRCKAQYEQCKTEYSKRLIALSANLGPEESKQYSEQFDGIEKQYVDIRDKMYENKQQEIEEAYKEYQAKHEAEQADELEAAKARGEDVVQGFNMFDNING